MIALAVLYFVSGFGLGCLCTFYVGKRLVPWALLYVMRRSMQAVIDGFKDAARVGVSMEGAIRVAEGSLAAIVIEEEKSERDLGWKP